MPFEFSTTYEKFRSVAVRNVRELDAFRTIFEAVLEIVTADGSCLISE